MKIRITNTPLPKHQMGKYVPTFPPGFLQAMQMTGWNPPATPFTFPQSMINNVNLTPINIPLDRLVDESTVDRPPADEVVSGPSAEAQRFSAVVGQKGLYDNQRISPTELDKLWKSAAPKRKSASLFPNIPLASAMVAGLQALGSGLQEGPNNRKQREYTIKRGMTDNYFPTVPYFNSRGTTEINTGEMFSNLQVPVQFTGTTVAPYYGQYQMGALVPDMPYDVPYNVPPAVYEAPTPSVPDVSVGVSEAESEVFDNKIISNDVAEKIKSSKAEMSLTHNNPLNIHIGNFAKKYGAVKGKKDAEGHVAIFPDLETGIQATKDLLFSPNSNYYNLTISQARKRWVGFDNEGTRNSIKDLINIIGSDKKLKDLTPKERDSLIKGFAKWEGKSGYNAIKDIALYKEGGEYELTDDEIDYILANGGEVEYL